MAARDLKPADLATLHLAPFWMLSVVTSKDSDFSPDERGSFQVALTHARVLATEDFTMAWLDTVIAREPDLWLQYADDRRSVNTGLHDVGRILSRLDADCCVAVRDALLRTIGGGVATARGPFGQRPSLEDLQRLRLAAVLIGADLDATPVR